MAGLVLLFGSVGICLGLYRFVAFWMVAPQGAVRAVFYEVKKSSSPMGIAHDLERLGIITNARMFYWYGRMTGKLNRFKAGDYRFMTNMKPDGVISVIMSGISYGYPITIPEGYTLEQIAMVIDRARPGAKQEFLSLCRDFQFISSFVTAGILSAAPPTLEGFLFPETYLMTRKTPLSDLIHQMVRKYRSVMSPDRVQLAQSLGLTEYQLVTLASIVERETGDPSERPLVASVFHNRLKKKMRLQSDPTVVYGLKDYNGNITKKDLLTRHPYNTYVVPGLPVGPISNPGREALLATLSPAKTEYLYFVSHNNGTHEFTSTYGDHQRAVSKFQLDPRAREGHSWRELDQKHREKSSQELPDSNQ